VTCDAISLALQPVRVCSSCDDHVGGLFDHRAKFFAAKQRHRLTGVKDERGAALGELVHVLKHRFAPVRSDNADVDVLDITHMVFLRAGHRARVECGDLVVVQIRGDEALRRELLIEHAHAVEANTMLLQVRAVGRKILANRGYRQRVAAKQFQVIGNVAGAAAKFTAHAWHQERHIKNVDLIRQDVILELILEHHDGVVGQRSADDGRHDGRGTRDKEGMPPKAGDGR